MLALTISRHERQHQVPALQLHSSFCRALDNASILLGGQQAVLSCRARGTCCHSYECLEYTTRNIRGA